MHVDGKEKMSRISSGSWVFTLEVRTVRRDLSAFAELFLKSKFLVVTFLAKECGN